MSFLSGQIGFSLQGMTCSHALSVKPVGPPEPCNCYELPSDATWPAFKIAACDSAVTDVGCQPDRPAMTSQLARGESASVSARWAAAIQKVLRVGFLTHQVMVGFGMRVGANTAEYSCKTWQFHKLMLDMAFQCVRLCKSYLRNGAK